MNDDVNFVEVLVLINGELFSKSGRDVHLSLAESEEFLNNWITNILANMTFASVELVTVMGAVNGCAV